MYKSFLSAALLATAGILSAAPGFTDKPGKELSKDWQTAAMTYNQGIVTDANAEKFTINNFKNPNMKGHPCWAVERSFDECKGDFTASLDMTYDVKDHAFMGGAMMQLIGTDGKVLAEIGLFDAWSIYAPVSLVNIENKCPKNSGRFGRLASAGQVKYTIERSGSEYIFSLNGKKLTSVAAEAKAVKALRIYFRQMSFGGNAKLPAGHFGSFTINEVSFTSIKRSGLFSEKPGQQFAPEWRKIAAVGADDLKFSADKDGMKIDGFVNVKDGKFSSTSVTYERKVNPLKGDFTAVLDMQWNLKDNAFMGDVMLQALDGKGNILAQCGIYDVWVGYQPRAGFAINGKTYKPLFSLPNAAAGPFIIERRGDTFTVRLREWKFLEAKGSEAPVESVRLLFQHKRYKGNNTLKPSHFGEFIIRKLELTDKVAAPLSARQPKRKEWKLTEPIIWYWAGPDMSDEFAAELAAGGWNVAFGRNMFDLDVMHRHGIKGVLWLSKIPKDPENLAQFKNWLESVRHHPALLGISCGDEPGGTERMLQAQRRVEFMIENAPELLHFNNMYPCGASNKQLGQPGAPIEAYELHIKDYFTRLKPQLLSYDKYHFFKSGDGGSYFFNQAIIREAALRYNVPSMNIVQGCAWGFHWRVPTPQEYRYLAYTSLAYGSKGLSCYVYGYKGHWGSMRDPVTGKTGIMYEKAKVLNREFYAIAKELMDLKSLQPYHTGVIPYGGVALPEDCEFQLEPRLKNVSQGLGKPKSFEPDPTNMFARVKPITGWMVSLFGKDNKASHVLVVNLDYKNTAKTTLTAPGKLEKFDAVKRTWSAVNSSKAELEIPAGSGVLLRLAK